MRSSITGHPDGWYLPGQGARPTYLGRNVLFAERRLIELIRNDAAA